MINMVMDMSRLWIIVVDFQPSIIGDKYSFSLVIHGANEFVEVLSSA